MAIWTNPVYNTDDYSSISPTPSQLDEYDYLTATADDGYELHRIRVITRYATGGIVQDIELSNVSGKKSHRFRMNGTVNLSSKSVNNIEIIVTTRNDPSSGRTMSARYLVDNRITVEPRPSQVSDKEYLMFTADRGYLIKSFKYQYFSGSAGAATTQVEEAEGKNEYLFQVDLYQVADFLDTIEFTVETEIDPTEPEEVTWDAPSYLPDANSDINPKPVPLNEFDELTVTTSEGYLIDTVTIETRASGGGVSDTWYVDDASGKYEHTFMLNGLVGSTASSFENVDIKVTTKRDPNYIRLITTYDYDSTASISPTPSFTYNNTEFTATSAKGYLLSSIRLEVIEDGYSRNRTVSNVKGNKEVKFVAWDYINDIEFVDFMELVIHIATEDDPDEDPVLLEAEFVEELENSSSNISGNIIKENDILTLTANEGHYFTGDIRLHYLVGPTNSTELRVYNPDFHPEFFNEDNSVFTLDMSENWLYDKSVSKLTVRAQAKKLSSRYFEDLDNVTSNIEGVWLNQGEILELTADVDTTGWMDGEQISQKFRGDIRLVFTYGEGPLGDRQEEILLNIKDNPEYFDSYNTKFTFDFSDYWASDIYAVNVYAVAGAQSYKYEVIMDGELVTDERYRWDITNNSVKTNYFTERETQGFNGDVVVSLFIDEEEVETRRYNIVEQPEYFTKSNAVFQYDINNIWQYDGYSVQDVRVVINARTSKQFLKYQQLMSGAESNIWEVFTRHINWNAFINVHKGENTYYDNVSISFKRGSDGTILHSMDFTVRDNPEYFYMGSDNSLKFRFNLWEHWHIIEDNEEIDTISAYVRTEPDGLHWDGTKWVVRTDIDRLNDWGISVDDLYTVPDYPYPYSATVTYVYPHVYGVDDSKTFIPGYTFVRDGLPNPHPDDPWNPDSGDEPLDDYERVVRDRSDLDLGDTSNVTSDLPLVPKGENGSTITWISSNPDILSTNGVIRRPEAGESDAVVTLSALITFGEEQVVKEFVLTIKAMPENPDPDPEDDPIHERGTSYYETLQNAFSNIQTSDVGSGVSTGRVEKDLPVVIRSNQGFEFRDAISVEFVRDGTVNTRHTFYPDTDTDSRFFNDTNTIFTITLDEFWGYDNVIYVNITAIAKEALEDEDPVDGIGGLTTSFANIYYADNSTLARLATERFSVDSAGVLTSDFGDYIYNVYKFPLKIDDNYISRGSVRIQMGYHNVFTESRYFQISRLQFNLGEVTVPEVYNNIYDYRDTMCKLHVPYSDPIDIEPTYVVGTTVKMMYFLDLYNGAVTLDVYSDKIEGGLVLRQDIPVSYEIPFIKPDEKTSSGTVGRYINNKIEKPYIEVTRNIPYDTDTQFGKGGKAYGQIKDFNGYVEIPDVNLETMAKGDEVEEIKSILANGIFIN